MFKPEKFIVGWATLLEYSSPLENPQGNPFELLWPDDFKPSIGTFLIGNSGLLSWYFINLDVILYCNIIDQYIIPCTCDKDRDILVEGSYLWTKT